MSVEDAIEKVIGPFGKYQTWILILLCLGRFPTEYQIANVVFIIPSVNYKCLDSGANNATNLCPCNNPDYDQSAIVSSVTSEWRLICDRTSLASLAQSMLQIGILIGSLIYGHISDRSGRRPAVLLAVFLTPLFVVLSAIVPEFWMFLLARFLTGTSVGGTMLCCYILMVELSGKSFRPYLIGLYELTYVVNYFSLPIISYFVRDWRHLQLVTGAPWLLVIIVYFFLIPESPRWLITVGDKEKALEILTHIAIKNNRPTENIAASLDQIEKETKSQNQQRGTYADLFRTPKIRAYTILSALLWMCCAHTYFGVLQYLGQLQGNLYLNVLVSAACQVPVTVIVVIAALHLRRKVSVVACFSTAAISLLAFIILPGHVQYASLTSAVIALTAAYTAFVLVYLYSSEIFPTIIRNRALGFSSVFARLGGFVAPFVVNIGIEWVSILIFSAISFSGAFICLFLPETKDIVLLNSVDQIEKSNRKKNTKCSMKNGKNITLN